ncbi:MAG TPA: ROK family protein, partial [Rhodopila sp.]|nr:ROK family protein [Rhodopila sp.]
MPVRIGVDVGGTFTDVIMVREDGQALVSKVTTTPQDPGEGVIAGIQSVLTNAGEHPRSIGEIVHGTTVAS